MSELFRGKRLLMAGAVLLLAFSMIILAACDVGLGSRVNTEQPKIGMGDGDNVPGSFLQGEDNRIWLDVQQEFGLTDVYMTVWYMDKSTPPEDKEIRIPAEFDPEKGLYFVDLDTSDMTDGTIRTQITAIDVSGNVTTTTDIIYTIKNSPAQVEMTIPKLRGEDFETWDFNTTNPSNLPLIYVSNDIMGIATDLYGIAEGYPQIMIWPVNDDGSPRGGITLASDTDGLSNEHEWGTWRTMLDDKGQELSHRDDDLFKLKAVMFRWSTLSLVQDGNTYRLRNAADGGIRYPEDYFDVGRYHFKVRVKDLFGVTNIYPYRIDAPPSDDPHPNQFMAIQLAETANPIVSWGTVERFYNRSEPLVRDVTINAKNGVFPERVFARITNSFSVNFNSLIDNQYVERMTGTDESAIYRIFIPADVVEEQLNELSPPVSGSTENTMLHIRAEDKQGNITVASIPFILDIDKPDIEFINPLGLETYLVETNDRNGLTSTFRFQGTTSDNQRVAKMYYALGKKEINNPSLGDAWNDNTGWTDTALDTTSPRQEHNPLDLTGGDGIRVRWLGSLNNWRWEFVDLADLYLASGQATLPNEENPQGGNDFLEYNPTFGHNIWHLPIKFKIVDFANNVKIIEVKVVIDPDKDRPEVTINSPTNDETVGGEVRVNGTATDNEIVFDVQIRVTAQTNEQIVAGSPGTWLVTHSNLYDEGDADYGFVPATMIGGGSSVNWFYTLNQDGALTPPMGLLRNVKIEVRARDASIYSPFTPKPIFPNHIVEEIYVNFSATVPIIDQVRIINTSPSSSINNTTPGDPYLMGAMVSGDLVLRARLSAIAGIASIKYRGENYQGFSNDLRSANFNNSEPYTPWVQKMTAEGEEYYIYIPLNTNAPDGLWNGRYFNRAGTYNIDIQVVDDTSPLPFTSQMTIALQIDNYYPGANFRGNRNAVGNQYSIWGNAWDTGDSSIHVYEVDKVVVYFSKPNGDTIGTVPLDIGSRVNLDGSSSGNDDNWTTQQVRIRRESTDSSVTSQGEIVTLPYFPKFTEIGTTRTYLANNAGYVINAAGGTVGTMQSFSGVPNKVWSIQVNTLSLPPGPIYVNYVVFDTAGNASYYREEIYIANNKPVISNIRLGTDINRDGVIRNTPLVPSTHEYFVYNPDTAAFRARNNLFNIQFDIAGGNGQKHYRIDYVRPENGIVNPIVGYFSDLDLPSVSIVKGQVYTINHMGSITVDEWIDLGVIGGPSNNNYNNITFVAKSNYTGSNHARVIRYNYGGTEGSANTQLSGNNIGTGNNIDNYTPTHPFTSSNFSAGRIPDSVKNAAGDVTESKNRFFIIKVFDSTVAGAENDSLSDALVIAVDIDNQDTKKPDIYIEPFYWNGDTDNSLYENKRDNGHIELENDLPASFNETSGINDRDPKVSGKVSFTGTASDNNTIGAIYFRINNHVNDSVNTITEHGASYYRAAVYNNGTWTPVNRFTENGWKFEIVPGSEKLNLDGHSIDWKLDFDSSFITGIVAADNIFSIIAVDTSDNRSITRDPSTWTDNLQTTGAAETEHYRFDVVPYITVLETPLSDAFRSVPSTFNRSALGWYPVREGDEIIIKGFNIGCEDDSASTVVTLNNDVELEITSYSKSEIRGNIDDASTSGALLLTVTPEGGTGIESINNKNNDGVDYNKEPNGQNNNELNDNRYLYVWSVGSLFTPANAAHMPEHPFMRMSNTGRRLITYGTYATNGRLRLLNNHAAFNQAVAGGVHIDVDNTINRYLNLGLAVDSENDWFIASSNMTANQANWSMLHARAATGNAGAQNTGTNKSRIISLGSATAQTTNRVRIPRLHARNIDASARTSMIVMSYGDDASAGYPIHLHYGTVTGGDTAAFSGNFTAAGGAGASTIQAVTSANSTYRGSMYTASASLTNGVPVIAWYDRERQSLIFSYGNVPEQPAAIPAAASMEYIYNATAHGLPVGTTRDNMVFVRAPGDDITSAGLRNVTKAPNANSFTIMELPAVANNQGQDAGATIVVNRAIPVTAALNVLGAGGVGNNQRNGMPGNYTGSPVVFTLPANHGLRLGDRVDIINGATVARDAYVVWLGIPVQGNANQVVFKQDNGNFAAADTGTLVPGFPTGTANANMYVVLKSRAANTITVGSVQTATVAGGVLQTTGRSGITYTNGTGTANVGQDLANNTRTFTLSANHGLALGDSVELIYNGTTYNLVVGWRGSAQNTNGNNVAFKTSANNVANWFNTVPAATAGNLVTITKINNPVGTIENATRTNGDRYYTAVGHGLVDNQIVSVNGSNYNVTQIQANNNTFKLASSGSVVDLGAGNITITLTSNPNIVTTDIDTWQGNAEEIKTGAGAHIDMALDPGNNIHLAYYDVFNGGLYYTYIPFAYPIPNTAASKTVKIDTYLSAGTKIMINVRDETRGGQTRYVPYISYFHASFAETRNAIRVAWPVNAINSVSDVLEGTDGSDRFTGHWEVMTVPARNMPLSDTFVCNGVPRYAGDWVALTGADALGGYFIGAEDTGANRRINRTVLVSYMTESRYEGAVLKRDIWLGP
ncbi:MAG: hypothetical protein FWD40_10700 [Treponema sp.]|nr:hypothetical protein [Treponema sp.]